MAISGSRSTGPLNATSQYILTCTGAGGSASQSATVTVSASTSGGGGGGGTTAPSVTISSDPSIVASGGSTTITWSSTNATACTASGAWSGTEPVSGTHGTGALTADTTYTLNCTGPGGSTQQSTTVTMSVPTALACTGNSGPLSLKVSAVRTSGISPFLMFFDATGTTDTSIAANTTTFQDVTYTWNFGDTGASGTGTWTYGSNPGRNSRNTATGGIAAHLYVTPGVDTAYTATVTATDGTNTASCQIGVTAYDPAGTNGFAGAKTTCVAASSTPVAGSGDCPAGAAVLETSSFATATWFCAPYRTAGKRVLFHCGDTFTGGGSTVSGAKWSIGAYGGCEGTQTARPVIKGSLDIGMQSTGDGRVADLDFESVGSLPAVISDSSYNYVTYQLTMYNLLSNGNNKSYYIAQCAQCGYIQLVQTGMGVNQGTFINFAENNQAQWGSNSLYNNIDYQAVLGSSFNGVGTSDGASGIETVRVSACRMCVFANNTMENANNVGAVFKLHNGNTKDSLGIWTGVYTELIEISDNLFAGTSGAQLVETAPQNGVTDERLRNIVVERNIFQGSDTGGGRQILVSAVNETVRDNAFNQHVAGGGEGIQVAKRGIEPVPQFVEVYNNTCYGGTCAAFSGSNFAAAGINSWAKNNLCFTGSCISNGGSGNTVSNNTTSTSSNPGFTNGSGSLSVISDFKPTASYMGGVSVPVDYTTPWGPHGRPRGTLELYTTSRYVGNPRGAARIGIPQRRVAFSSGCAVACRAIRPCARWLSFYSLGSVRRAAGVTGSDAPSKVIPTLTSGEPNGPACPATSGPLTLKVSTVRAAGVSPFGCSSTPPVRRMPRSPAIPLAFQDVTYTWNFGDTRASGSGTWAYGSNPGHNSKNTATGGVAAHLYITSGTDAAYTATVTATDGTHTASCQVPVTAYDPAGAKGFAGSKTTCVAASGTPVAGSGGCPAGASVLRTPSFTIATESSHIGSGRRVLFHCGDTYTGSGSLVSGTKWSIGAYGGCEGTQTKRPIVSGGGVNIKMQATGDAVESRIWISRAWVPAQFGRSFKQ